MKKTVVFCLFCVIFTLISASVCFAQGWGNTGFSDYNDFGGDDLDSDLPFDDDYDDDSFAAGPENPAVSASGSEDSAAAASVPPAVDSAAESAKAAQAAADAAAFAGVAEAAATKAETAATKAETAATKAETAATNASPPPPSSLAPPQPPVRIVIPMMTSPPPSAAPPAPPVSRPPPVAPPAQPAEPLQQQPPPVNRQPPINVIPAMPNPYSNSLHRVQIGAFSNSGLAQQCFSRLLSAGFSPAYEQYGNMYRVVLPGIRAADMTAVVQRLAAAGFYEIWIREER